MHTRGLIIETRDDSDTSVGHTFRKGLAMCVHTDVQRARVGEGKNGRSRAANPSAGAVCSVHKVLSLASAFPDSFFTP